MQSTHGKEGTALARVARGAVHTLGSAYAGRLVNWVAVIVLTRALAPEDFGHVALAASLLALVVSLRNFGLHNALLHKYERVDELAPTHLVLNGGLSALGTLAAVGLAVFFVDGHYGRNVATALAVFAAFDLLRATALTAETQLRRDLEFGYLAGAHALALIAAAAAGVAAAWLGAGVWALILSHSTYGIAYAALYCALLWRRRSPLRLRLSRFDRGEARGMLRYGGWIWLGAMLQTLLLHFDRLLVGNLLDARTLGFYDRAHVFAQLPTGALTHALTGVMLTVFARYQHEREQLGGAFRRTLRLILRAAVPFSVVLAIEIPVITRLLLGESWLPLASLLRWLLVYSLCRPVLEAVRSLLQSIGDPRGFAAFSAVQAGVLVIAAPLLTRDMGVEGTALAMNLAALVGTVLALRRSGRYAEVPWVRSFAPPLLAAAAAAALRLWAGPLIEGLPGPAALILGAALFGIAYGAALLGLERKTLVNELRTLWRVLRKGEGGERRNYKGIRMGEAPGSQGA